MFQKVLFTAVTGMIISFGIAGSANADPDGSQRNRGMADRVFLVKVEVVSTVIPGDTGPVGTKFDNCYYFYDGGVWNDPLFPVLGTWVQHSNGAATTYSAFAEFPPIGLVIMQEGSVTPAKGKGVLQLEAVSTLFGGPDQLAEFLSVGSEVDECPL